MRGSSSKGLLLFLFERKNMDFGQDYYKSYLNNCHKQWGIYSLFTHEIVEEISMYCKEGWKYLDDHYGAGYELVAIFPKREG